MHPVSSRLLVHIQCADASLIDHSSLARRGEGVKESVLNYCSVRRLFPVRLARACGGAVRDTSGTQDHDPLSVRYS